MNRGAQATNIFIQTVSTQCKYIRDNPTAEGIQQLKEILETWETEWYRKHRPELWLKGTKAIYEARVTLATYDKGTP